MAGMQRVHQLAIDIELELLVGGVADPYRRGCSRSRAATAIRIRSAALAGDAVHDLHFRRMTGDGAQQPLAPGPRLGAVA